MSLTDGPIAFSLLKRTNPMIWGMLAIISINLVETFFVAQLGTAELAAITFTFPIVIIMMNFCMGLSVGTASVLSRAIGSGNQSKVKRLTTDSLIISFAIVFLLAMIGYFTIDSLFKLLLIPDSLLPLVRSYMKVWYLGLPLIVTPIIANAALNASGEMRLTGWMMGLAALINLILDPLLIFGLFGFPRLEIQGAAFATIISYGIACIFALWLLEKRKKMLTYQLKLNEMFVSWKEMLVVGLPAAAAQMIIPITSGITLWMLAHFGPSIVAAFGVISRLEAFALITIFAFASTLGVFVGQNFGAGKQERVDRIIILGYRFSLIWGLFLALILGFCAPFIAEWFDPNPVVVETVAFYFHTVALTYGAVGCIFVTISYLNAVGKPWKASLISIIRYFVLYIPIAYMVMHYYGPQGIFIVIASINLLIGFSVYFLGKRML